MTTAREADALYGKGSVFGVSPGPSTAPSVAPWPADLAEREAEQSGEAANDDDAFATFKRVLAEHVPNLDPSAEYAIVSAALLYGLACEKRGISAGVQAMRETFIGRIHHQVHAP